MGDKIKNINDILSNYNTTLTSCINRISDNNKLNKEVVDEIQNKITLIKERVLKARDNVTEIGNQQTAFYNTMEQEKGKIREQQEKRMEESKKEQDRLQNKLIEAQSASAKTIQELEDKQKQKILELRERAGREADREIEKQKAEDQANLEIKMEELNKKMEEANRVAAENAAKIQKDAAEAKTLTENDRLVQEQKLQELEQKRQEIFEKDVACEEQLEKLKGNIAEMKGEIEKMKGDIATQIQKNETDKIEAAQTLETRINEITQTHKGEMEEEIKKAGEEKKIYMEKALADQILAIQKAAEEVTEANRFAQEEMTRATDEAKGNLQEQLAECQKSKKNYEKEVENHMEKYKELEKQFENSKNFALGGLKELVDELGEKEIADLEKTIEDILSKKGPGGTGTGGIGTISPLERQTSSEVADSTMRDAEREIVRSRSLIGDVLTGQEAVGQLDEEEDETARRKKEREDKKPSGNPKEAWSEEESHALAIDPYWVGQQIKRLPKIKENINNQGAIKAFREMLLEGIRKYINNIGTYRDFANLKDRIVDPHLHGMTSVDGFDKSYKRAMDSMTEANYESQNQRHLYDKILESMVSHDSNAYKHIIEEIIKQNGFEKVFEQLITAFHLLYEPSSIVKLYKNGTAMNESYMKRNGKMAIRLWYGNYDKSITYKKVPVRELKQNAEANGDRLIGSNDAQIEMKHMYYHKHDAVAKLGKTKVLAGRARDNLKRSISDDEAFAGGFRHGKRSQKKNKRTLKSKLTAKKYSLKVGKKKRGEKGNKSQKRRKSIKIRI